jgi:type I restriction-modification system DNA methylase subunit
LPASISSFKETVEKLTRRFESDRTHYLSKGYPEAQARVDFITPLFKALGWDVENEAGLPHLAREVTVERGESDTTGRPDYNFRLNGQTKFFVEAKAPAEPLDAPRHILQAKTYAWNTKAVSFVILTDFEEFRFYDASLKPDERRPDEGLLLSFTYTDYLKKAEQLWEFSRERVAAGSLEAMLPRDRRTQRLRIPPDESFLEDMTAWREDLARDVHKNNPGLTNRQLNEVVQRLLDRIVFIRIAEDRRVIERNQLRDVAEGWRARGDKIHIFEWLNDLFHRINEDFNGEIFKPHLSEQIKIDSEVLAKIIEGLYPPRSPYRFDVIGVELLGSIYERYLGKTIRVTPKQVRVEEKEEVRKAGGVYYTPKYIVDYIVKNTVGKIIEGKTPKQIEKIRILDPACGSGSFLIGAFQCLIDYHVRYLTEHPKEAHVHPLFPDLIRGENGEPRLSVVRKARILKNNLFGVDIDPQAVEITMMSLYLKALEGERSVLPPRQHYLPELKHNIICGNSLIGPDIYKDTQLGLFGDEERERINAFDWNSETAGFGQIMKQGGFDCVIANPPYRMLQPHNTETSLLDYLRANFLAAEFKIDLFHMFLQRGVSLLKQRGYLSFIVPTTILNNVYAEKLRGWLLGECSIEQIAIARGRVFADADVHTSILVLRREVSAQNRERQDVLTTDQFSQDFVTAPSFFSRTRQRTFNSLPGLVWNILVNNSNSPLIQRLANCTPLQRVATINRGLITGDRDKYFSKTKKTARHVAILAGSDVHRYYLDRASEFVLFKRPESAGGCWDEDVHFAPHKVVVRQICEQPTASLVTRPLAVTGNIFTVRADGLDTEMYLLGILNSRLTSFFWRIMFADFKTSFPQVTIFSLGQVPIREPLASDVEDKARHDKMVVLVEQMLELNKKKHSGKLAAPELEKVDRDIASTDREIDELVYELHGITAEERKIIEGVPEGTKSMR